MRQCLKRIYGDVLEFHLGALRIFYGPGTASRPMRYRTYNIFSMEAGFPFILEGFRDEIWWHSESTRVSEATTGRTSNCEPHGTA